MGDIWIQDNGVYNPVNVKSGEMGKNGQPNMVAIGRVFPALIEHRIDSYYLLIVKMDLHVHNRDAHIYLVDMLDYLDYTHLDTGPGQIMLREASFYEAVDSDHRPALISPLQKVEKLYEMLVDANHRLYANREKRQQEFEEQLVRYRVRNKQPVNQTDLLLK